MDARSTGALITSGTRRRSQSDVDPETGKTQRWLRSQSKTLRGAFTTWGDVQAAFETWAEQFSLNLAKARAETAR